jgi:hypothetical protein
VDSSDECKELDSAVEEALEDRLNVLLRKEDVDDCVKDDEKNVFLLRKGLNGIKITMVPDDWKKPSVKYDKGEIEWKDVDNPGDWLEFTYRPKFNAKTGNYVAHMLPTGARPVPKDVEGKRIHDGWEFHYKDWKSDLGATNRSGSSPLELIPAERKGCLDYEFLKKMRLSKRRIMEGDALFFRQLLLPMCDPKKSGIDDDPRLPYYSLVENWSSKYAAITGMTGSYGHAFKLPTIEELMHFDSAVIRDGVLGGLDGALHRRWDVHSSAFDADIANSIHHTRWLQLKRTFKLCDNERAPKRDQPGYDPAYKYDYLFRTIIYNLNAVTKSADLDQCGDETTFAHNGYGEPNSGLLSRVMGKPGVTRGGQIVLLSDVGRNRPRAYLHRHKIHPAYPKTTGLTQQGPAEVRRILEERILPLVEGFKKNRHLPRSIFPVKPHTTWDNYFSGDPIFNWMGANGFATTMTVRRDRLPTGVPGSYFNKNPTPNTDKKAKVGRFNHAITAVKTVPIIAPLLVPTALNEDDLEAPLGTGDPVASCVAGTISNGPIPTSYTRVHVSFQSTSSCNIACVDSLNQNTRFVTKKERGRGEQKRQWGIENNDARQLYLATYGRIDTLDAYINRCRMYYRSWKYWHAAKLHGDAMAVVVAYDMYCECTKEAAAREAFGITDDDKFEILDFHQFRDRLSTQGLQYSPLNTKYPGDAKMRSVTQQKKRKRVVSDVDSSPRKRGRPRKGEEKAKPSELVTLKQLDAGKMNGNFKSRLTGDLRAFKKHLLSMKRDKHPKICKWCGANSYTYCGICKKFLHFFPSRGPNKGKACFVDHHNTTCFGLAREDMALLGKKKSEWKRPSEAKKRANAIHIQKLEHKMEEEIDTASD